MKRHLQYFPTKCLDIEHISLLSLIVIVCRTVKTIFVHRYDTLRDAILTCNQKLTCFYRVRGVEGSCAKHLTIEFYTVVILLTFILIIISIPSPHHSFTPGLKPSFSVNPSVPTVAFLFFFRTDSKDSPDCLLILLSIPVFLLFSSSVFLFLVVGSVAVLRNLLQAAIKKLSSNTQLNLKQRSLL